MDNFGVIHNLKNKIYWLGNHLRRKGKQPSTAARRGQGPSNARRGCEKNALESGPNRFQYNI